jgi:hypothetical protein
MLSVVVSIRGPARAPVRDRFRQVAAGLSGRFSNIRLQVKLADRSS